MGLWSCSSWVTKQNCYTTVSLGVVLILARPCTAYLVRMRDDMLLLHNRIAKVAVDRVDPQTTLTML